MIRKALKKDIDRINELGLLVSPNFLQTYKINEYLDNDKYIVLVNEEEIVNAFLLIYTNVDSFELEMIVVDPKRRKKGIASSLLKHFLDNYGTIRKVIFLEVSINNDEAIRLYKKNNFEIISTRPKYYNGIDAYVMKKEIS